MYAPQRSEQAHTHMWELPEGWPAAKIHSTDQFHPDAPQQLLGEANFTGAIRNYRDEEIDKRQAAAAP